MISSYFFFVTFRDYIHDLKLVEAQEDYTCTIANLLRRLGIARLEVLCVLISRTRGTNRGEDGIYRLMLHVVEGLAYERIVSFECGANSPGMSWDRFKL